MRTGANLPAVGGYNQAVILDAIRRAEGGISRTEVAERTGLSAQTASNVCRKLLGAGLIREAGTQIAGVGKPRTILQLEPHGRIAVGVHLDPSVITLVLLDLAGSVVAHLAIPATSDESPASMMERIETSVRGLVSSNGIPIDRLMGAGIAAPGPVDVRNGMVLNPPLLPAWESVPLREALSERLGMPVLLEKDATAAVVAELWMRSGGDRDNMIFFYYGTGVGTGLAIGGEVVRGYSNNAGDVGAVIVGGVLDRASRRWRLGDAIMPRLLVQEAIDAGVLDHPGDEPGVRKVQSLFGRLADAAEAGEPRAAAILDAVASDIAAGLMMMTNLLDITRVVFGGRFFHPIAGFMLERIPGLVSNSGRLVPPHPVAFVESAIGEDVAAIGAACLVLDHAFSPRPAGLLIRR